MKKVLCLALVITSLFMLPVSADNLFIGEWGMGVVRPRTTDKDWTLNTWKILNYPYTVSYGSQADTLYFFTQFGWLPDYTYTVTIDYYTSQKNYFTNLNFDFFTSEGYTINNNYDNYQNVKWNIQGKYFYDDSTFPFIVTKSEETWLNPDDLYNNYYHITYTIVFSNAIVNLSDMDYLLGRWSSSLPGVGVELLQPNMDVSAYYDPGGQIYQEVIVDLVQQIIDAGSDKISSIPTNGDDLSDAVTDLDNAEKDLYNKSDSLIENVQTQLDESKNQAVAALPNLTTTALAVTNVYNQIKSTLPNEVKVLFVVIPVILFFAYLIGRKD